MENLQRLAALPLVDNACASRANRDSWTYSVFCREVCPAQREDRDAILVQTESGPPLCVKLTQATAADLSSLRPMSLIRAYSEWRTKFSEGQYLTLLFYHAFMFLEVEGGLAICTEKYNDKLELMFGERDTLMTYGRCYRATGEPRRHSLQHSEVQLETFVTVQELVDWICGPLAIVWRPYCLINSNCQHYARDLVKFLHDKRLAENLKSDREVVLSAVLSEGCRLQYADKKLQDDRELVSAALTSDGAALAFASRRLRCDKALALAAVRGSGAALQFCDPILQGNEEIVLTAVGKDATALRFASQEMKRSPIVLNTACKDANGFDWSRIFSCSELAEDEDVALAAVGLDWRAGEYISERLRTDAAFMQQAVALNGLALKLAPESLSHDYAAVLSAVRQSGLALEFACDELRAEPRLVREAVVNNGMALEFVEEAVRSRDLVLAAVARNGYSLQFAPEALKQDQTVVLTAARRFLFVDWEWLFCEKAIKDSRAITLAAVCADAAALRYSGWRGDKEVVSAAVQRQGDMLEFATQELQSEKGVVLTAVAADGTALRFAAASLQGCREVVSLAVKQNALALQFAEPGLRHDADLLKLAARRWWSFSWGYLFSANVLRDDRDVVLAAVKLDWRALECATEEMRADVEVVCAATAQSASAARFAAESLLQNHTAMLEIVACRGAALQYASDELRSDPELVRAAVLQDRRALQFASEELRGSCELASLASQMRPGIFLRAFAFAAPARLQNMEKIWKTVPTSQADSPPFGLFPLPTAGHNCRARASTRGGACREIVNFSNIEELGRFPNSCSGGRQAAPASPAGSS